MRELLAFVDTHPIERFIIDLSSNGGGDSRIMRPLIGELKKRAEINRKGHLFAAIGRKQQIWPKGGVQCENQLTTFWKELAPPSNTG